jgi:hypothetical protein
MGFSVFIVHLNTCGLKKIQVDERSAERAIGGLQ